VTVVFAPCPKPPKREKSPRKSVKRRNVKRHSANWLRAYGSPERVEWVTWQPSVVSGYVPCDNAHVRSGGKSRKADACWIVPLLPDEHDELHKIGKASFEAKYDLDLDALAGVIEMAWKRFLAGESVGLPSTER